MYDIYTGLLRMMDAFRDDGRYVEIEYRIDTRFEQLREKYQLDKLAGNGDDFSKITSLLAWEAAHIHHKGNYDNHIRNTAMALFDYSFNKGIDFGINCRSLSIALTECFLALGLKARSVYLMPFSPYDTDNHVVCEVWCRELSKWVMVDPTYNLYLMDDKGTPLNIWEIRESLAYRKELKRNEGCHYNGSDINTAEIINYYAKDFFYFQIFRTQGYDIENIQKNWMLTIAPIGFDVKKSRLANIDYRIAKWGSNEGLQQWRKMTEDDFIIYKGMELLK